MKLEAVQDNNVELVTEILGDISSLSVRDDSAAELSRILQEPHFQVPSFFLSLTHICMPPMSPHERREGFSLSSQLKAKDPLTY